MMRTKLARKYGSGKSVETYTDLAAGEQDLGCYENTIKRAHEIYNAVISHVAESSPSMLACAVLFLAAKSTGEYIRSQDWTEKLCAYPTLLKQAKRLLPIVNEKHVFPNLRDLKLGND